MLKLNLILTVSLMMAALPLSPVCADEASASTPERVVEIFETLAADIQGKEDSCKKVSKALNSWWENNEDELTSLVKTAKPAIEALSDNEQHTLDRRLRPAMGTVFNAAMKCSEHKATAKILEDIDTLLSADTP